MLRGYCDSIRSSVSSSVIELETLKVRVSEALWLLSVFPTPTEVIAEASEASVVTKDLWVPMALLGSSPRSHPFLCCVRPRSNARLWRGVGWG